MGTASMRRKKLQVFVSSTYEDLRDERQAAVEAILTAGHIPAGMELFAAGDQSQLQVIRTWIEESDVFLLLLAGRYGSIEPTSGKSYIQVEYEHAVALSKPLFAVVIEPGHLEEKVKAAGTKVVEIEHASLLRGFKTLVQSRMVRFWRDHKDIKLAILETLAEFSRREDLVGWVPGSEAIDGGAVAEEIARLAKENTSLREQVSRVTISYNGLTFDQLYRVLADTDLLLEQISKPYQERLNSIAVAFGDSKPGLLHGFWFLSHAFVSLSMLQDEMTTMDAVNKLCELGLIENAASGRYRLTLLGQQFLLRLRLEKNVGPAEQYRLRASGEED